MNILFVLDLCQGSPLAIIVKYYTAQRYSSYTVFNHKFLMQLYQTIYTYTQCCRCIATYLLNVMAVPRSLRRLTLSSNHLLVQSRQFTYLVHTRAKYLELTLKCSGSLGNPPKTVPLRSKTLNYFGFNAQEDLIRLNGLFSWSFLRGLILVFKARLVIRTLITLVENLDMRPKR